VHGVGPSTVLGGRYAVQRRLEQMPRAERWAAHDLTLERDVLVVCFGEEESHAAATLDAARRVAGLDNHRLVRVLDVGRSEGVAFFVEEAIHDAHTLTQLLEQGGLPAEEVRRIAGEAASGLEAARARGLHHLRLGPDSVLRAHDGTVKVRGVATAAAMAAEDDVDATSASRTDAVGVVALTYAALTSRWPLPGTVPGLESAPHVVGGVPAPSEIAAGVPGDLDALCRLTLNEDQGPLTPGDFASQIAPWATAQVTALGGRPAPATDDGASKTIALPVGELPRSTPGQRTDPSAPAVPVTPLNPAPAAPGTESQPSGIPQPTGNADPGDEDEEPGGPGSGAAAAASAAAAATAVGSAIGTAGHVAGQAAGVAAQRVGTFARATADKAAERRAQRQAAEEHAEQRRISLDQALIEGHETLPPPLPMLAPDTAEAPSRNQSKLVLAIMATFLVVVTLLGFWGVSHIGSGTHLALGEPPTPRGTVKVTAPAVTVTPSQSGSTGAQAESFAILSATGFDPEGDGAERNGEAPRVFDGNPDTFWSSEGYASANLGGLKKGVGVRIDLGQNHPVSTVGLVLPDASDVTVYVGQDRTLDSATEIGSSKGKSGNVTVTADKPVQGQYVFVWFTKVSQVKDGRFRATLAEVTVG
jgi:eukaryotic-like serine/threonine-protein kinase